MYRKYKLKKGFYRIVIAAKHKDMSDDIRQIHLMMEVKSYLEIPFNVGFLKQLMEETENKTNSMINIRFLLQSLFKSNDRFNEFCEFCLKQHNSFDVNYETITLCLNRMFSDIKVEICDIISISYMDSKAQQTDIFRKSINDIVLRNRITLNNYKYIYEKDYIIKSLKSLTGDKIRLSSEGIFYVNR